MLRQLLTLLAVFSGFTLAAEPVSAADVRAVSVAATGEQADCAATDSTPIQHRQTGSVRDVLQTWLHAHEPTIAPAPRVYIQVDRARE